MSSCLARPENQYTLYIVRLGITAIIGYCTLILAVLVMFVYHMKLQIFISLYILFEQVAVQFTNPSNESHACSFAVEAKGESA